MIGPERVAAAVVHVIEHDAKRRLVPRWIALPIRVRGIAPAAYRAISRHFGG
jgi:hypothetical protein